MTKTDNSRPQGFFLIASQSKSLSKKQGVLTPKFTPLLILFCCTIIVIYSTQRCTATPSNNEIVQIYKEIAKDRPLTIKGTRASFHDGETEWTIFGAVQQKAEPHATPSVWSVGGKAYEILVVNEAVSDIAILPYSEPVPNTVEAKTISLKAYRDAREPSSFVIRSGDQALVNVTIKASPLKNMKGGEISLRHIDVRGVKCWYQSGLELRRRDGDRKRLTPELLLHDLNLVLLDHKHQVNLVRNMSKLNDADNLLPFGLPPRTNQQIWVSTYVPGNTEPGKYFGEIEVSMMVESKPYIQVLKLEVEVSPLELNVFPVEHALFYLAWYAPNQIGFGARGKNARQMLAEFKDMRAHGLTNVAIDHQFRTTQDGEPDFNNLEPVIKLFREAGFTTNRFLYVDWKVTGWDNPGLYRKKIGKLKELVNRYGFTELYVYNKDEQKYHTLKKLKSTFEIVHEFGGKNFVACERTTAMLMRGLLDQAVLPRGTPTKGLNSPELNLCVNGDMFLELGKPGAAWRSTNEALMNIGDGKLRKKRGGYVYFVQTLPIEEGVKYRLEYEVISVKTPGLMLAAGGGSAVEKDVRLPLALGKNRTVFTSNNNNLLRFAAATNAEFEISNVVVTKIGEGPTGRIGVWAYGEPQAGMETPGTYRRLYGTGLLSDGFEGVCNYAYQSGDCWDDWGDPTWRPHVMAYPTMGAPIPTLQWEGWRKAVDDIRRTTNSK
jgi:hypothetical protein